MAPPLMERQLDAIGAANLAFAERLYRAFLEDRRSVPAAWQRHFAGLGGEAAPPREPRLSRPSIFHGGRNGRAQVRPGSQERLQSRVEGLAQAYRRWGYRAAALDPLGLDPLGGASGRPAELGLGFHGLRETDLERTVRWGPGERSERRSVRWVVEHLERSYCGPLAVQLAHLEDREAREWVRRRMETPEKGRPEREERIRLCRRLTEAVVFEEFVRKKFIGAKSFSLEGAETLLLALDALVDGAGRHGADELVLAMTHRGRLNVLANLLQKPVAEIFRELKDEGPRVKGDLRHHLGASTRRAAAGGRPVHLSLCFNPSHLEFVSPIALGRVRAKQDREGDAQRRRCLAVLVHGDAGIAGEGVAYETLNLARLPGYSTGGAVHLVLDNQIGFTTPPEEGRSSARAADGARPFGAPIFHVNGDDPEAVVRAAALALDFRRSFGRDACVELRCYRRFGHNEMDEPRFTQPRMYAAVEEKPSVRALYLRRLVEEGVLAEDDGEDMAREHRRALQERFDALAEGPAGEEGTAGEEARSSAPEPEPSGVWAGFRGGPVERRGPAPEGPAEHELARLLEATTRLPAGFRPHPKAEKLLESRRAMARGEQPLDWAAAESLALASLAAEGVPVRLSGQDAVRGTFSQRHAALFDQESGQRYEPLRHVTARQAPVEVANSPLSEVSVMGFEYGYSLDRPAGLTLWEAQFGDFANAAQVVIDQLLVSAEEKWRRLSGLVLLLPHGFEGQGPEHSSARPERFLAAAAQDNLQVAQPTTPAQYFHLLRRQALQRWRKPLVVLTPKSLLRHEQCVSSLGELSGGAFRRVLGDEDPGNGGSADGDSAGGQDERGVRRVLLCSGKLYYELLRERRERGGGSVALVRLEELYPFPEAELAQALVGCPDETRVAWVQEEPSNMGAWRYLRARFPGRLLDRWPLFCVARPESASPAGGSGSVHRKEQEELLERALGGAS